jgi:hypothetical protein
MFFAPKTFPSKGSGYKHDTDFTHLPKPKGQAKQLCHFLINFVVMDIHELNNATSKLDEKNRAAIIETINIKTESDMEKVLMKIQSEFGGIRAELSKIDSQFAHVEDKIDTMKWVIGIAWGALTLFVAFLAFKIK